MAIFYPEDESTNLLMVSAFYRIFSSWILNFIEVKSVINIVESALNLPEAIESLKLPLIFDSFSFLQVMSV